MNLPENLALEPDLIYNQNPNRPLRLHLLRSRQPSNQGAPALVFVHGGAFRMGSRDDGIGPLIPFAERGYVCASLEYRLSGEALWPAQIEDVKCGVRFLRANAGRFGLDPERIGAWGPSAGGHLVTMLGVTGGVGELEGDGGWAGFSSRVQAVCNWFGPSDFLQMNRAGSIMDHDAPDSPESELIGGAIQQYPDKTARANPISYIPGADIPPFLIVHGDADPLVPFNQSELLYQALKQAHAPVVFFRRIAGAGHGGPAFESEEIKHLLAMFFDLHLRGRP